MAVNEWVPMDTDDYTVGQITLTAGSSDVTFTNAFNGAESSFYAGDSIYVQTAGKWLLLASITSRTAGTLLYPCPADCAGTFDLRLRPLSRNARQAGLAAMVLRNLQVGNLPALADLPLAPGQVPVAGQVQGSFVAGDLPTAPDLSPYMQIETYDKNGKKADVYDAGNFVENTEAQNNKGALILTNAERQAILDNTDGVADNKAKIDAIKGLPQDDWNAGTSTIEALISPEKLKASISTKGTNWVKYLDGTIIQWGTGGGIDPTVYFPTSFTKRVSHISLSPNVDYSANVMMSRSYKNVSLTSFTALGRYVSGSTVGQAGEGFTWLAIGE